MERICKAVWVLFYCEFFFYGCRGLQQTSKLDIDLDENMTGKVFDRLNALEAKCELQADENIDLRDKMTDLESLVYTLQAENQHMKEQIRLLQARDTEEYLNYSYDAGNDVDEMPTDEISNAKARHALDQSQSSISTSDNTSNSKRKLGRPRRSENDANVAFFAKISSHHLEHLGANQTLVFDQVITNIGNAYNSHVGDFIAPVTGTYVFSVTLMTYGTGTIHCQMVQSGRGVANIYAYTKTPDETSSLTAVLELKQGEDLVIHNLLTDVNIHGYGYSYFSGFLLRQDFSNPDIIGK